MTQPVNNSRRTIYHTQSHVTKLVRRISITNTELGHVCVS